MFRPHLFFLSFCCWFFIVLPCYFALLLHLVATPCCFTLLLHLTTSPCYVTLLFCLAMSPCCSTLLLNFFICCLVTLPCYHALMFCLLPHLATSPCYHTLRYLSKVLVAPPCLLFFPCFALLVVPHIDYARLVTPCPHFVCKS